MLNSGTGSSFTLDPQSLLALPFIVLGRVAVAFGNLVRQRIRELIILVENRYLVPLLLVVPNNPRLVPLLLVTATAPIDLLSQRHAMVIRNYHSASS